MSAGLIHREKHVLPDGSVIEMAIWRVPKKIPEHPHGIKYRLYYWLKDGTCLVRYDNEVGKGDHRHTKDREIPYKFVDVETLMDDFLKDVGKIRRKFK